MQHFIDNTLLGNILLATSNSFPPHLPHTPPPQTVGEEILSSQWRHLSASQYKKSFHLKAHSETRVVDGSS